jgi:PAS domain S-box-containing protein
MSFRYRVLLIEDSVQDAIFNLHTLERGGMEVESERVETANQMQTALETKTWDFILSDYHLPYFDGTAALALYRGMGLDIPFIVVSGLIGEEQAVALVKSGAHDFVMKDNLAQLVPAVKRELAAVEERWIRQRTRATESFLASIVRDTDGAVIGETLDGQVVSWNPGAERLYGYTASEIMGARGSILESTFRPAEQATILQKLKRGEWVPRFETVHMRKNGTPVEVSLTISPIIEPRGRTIGASTLAEDITVRKQEENERLVLIQELSAALAQTSCQAADRIAAP